MVGYRLLFSLLLICTGVAVAVCPAAASTSPATNPSTQPAEPPASEHLTREQRIDRLFTYLVKEYSLQLSSKDWITRGVAVVSLAQFPTDDASKILIDRVLKETHPVARPVAWQAVLARVGLLSEPQFKLWQQSTAKMMKDDLFHGDLRIALLEMLSSTPITRDNRRFVEQLFVNTNSLDSTDVPTLVAMGRAIRAWGDGELIESLLAAAQQKNQSTRAKLVLKAAGADPGLDADLEAFNKWWKENKTQFTGEKPKPGAWKSLRPQFVRPPVDVAKVDPSDKQWYQQLELGALGLGEFDFALTVDCSHSMRGELARLKRDLLVMYVSFNQVAQKARLAITGFSCDHMTRNFLALTENKDELLKAIKQLDIFGPVGEEEWAGGLELCIKSNQWRPISEHNRRVIVLITDEPLTADQFAKTKEVVKQAASDRFKLYMVLVLRPQTAPDPFRDPHSTADDNGDSLRGMPAGRRAARIKEYEELAAMTGGHAVLIQVPQGELGLGTAMKWAGGPARNTVPTGPADIAPVYPTGGPTAQLLGIVLADAISPQYAKRVEPLVKILTEHNQHVAWVAETR